MKRLYLEPEFEVLGIQSEDFLALSPDDSDEVPDDIPEEFTDGTSGEVGNVGGIF